MRFMKRWMIFLRPTNWKMQLASIIRHPQPSRFFAFFASPVLQSILMLMMMGGLYFELQTPGIGFAGLMAGIGAALFFAPHLYARPRRKLGDRFVSVLAFCFYSSSCSFYRGSAVAGIAGLILVLGSLFAALVGNVGLQFPDQSAITSALATMAVTLTLMVILAFSLARYLPTVGTFSRLVLAPELSSAEGYTSADTDVEILGSHRQSDYAATACRNGGTRRTEPARRRDYGRRIHSRRRLGTGCQCQRKSGGSTPASVYFRSQ